jgi:hypothetical protein
MVEWIVELLAWAWKWVPFKHEISQIMFRIDSNALTVDLALVVVALLIFLLTRLRKGAKKADVTTNYPECKPLHSEGAEMYLMSKKLEDGKRSLAVSWSCCRGRYSSGGYEVVRTFLAGQKGETDG